MIRIVFQNNHFIVCDKPPEVLSVPAREKSDLRFCLGTALQNQIKQQVFPVHRLDYEVSGLIMFALDAKSHKASQSWFEKKLIQKIYKAQTGLQSFSHWPSNIKTEREQIEVSVGNHFYWRTQMLRGKKRTYESSQGEWAETKALIKQKTSDLVSWELRPVTGKSHQLRFELSRRGFPIVGDKLYGSDLTYPEQGIALRAVKIDLSKVSDRFGLPVEITG